MCPAPFPTHEERHDADHRKAAVVDLSDEALGLLLGGRVLRKWEEEEEEEEEGGDGGDGGETSRKV